MPINYGILQTAPTQPQMSIVSSPNANAQEAAGLLSGASVGSNIASNMQANKRAEALMPGQLEMQQAQIEHEKAATGLLGTQGKNAEIELKLNQRKQAYQSAADNAYHAEMASNGDLNKATTSYANALSPEDRVTFTKAIEDQKSAIADGNAKQIVNAAGIVSGAIDDINKGADPNKIIPYINTQLDRVDPNHPKLRTKEDLHNYGVVTIGSAMDPKTQALMQADAQKTAPEVIKLQQAAAQKQAEYNAMPDKNSPEAVRTLTELNQINDSIDTTIHGKPVKPGLIEQGVTAATNFFTGGDGIKKQVNGMINNVTAPETKVINGTTYIQQDGKWYTK